MFLFIWKDQGLLPTYPKIGIKIKYFTSKIYLLCWIDFKVFRRDERP